MNGRTEDIFELKIIERNDRAKKVYRYVVDVAKRLGEATTGSDYIGDLFTMSIEKQRQKLRDNCEKLYFLDPENYGKKSLELLWRKVYYDTVSAAKKLKESDNKYDNHLLTHIISGIGQFHNIIIKVQSEMNVDQKELDFLPLYHDEEADDSFTKNTTEEETELHRSTIYLCLIYLGDLSRYQVEIFNAFEKIPIAARYYFQAAQIDCQVKCPSGMPFNQLGNLYLGKNFNLDSACYYIHCLSFVSPFEGASGNLAKIFEKNSQYCDLNDSGAVPLTQTEHMQITIVNFLSLVEKWYFDKDDNDVPRLCSAIAHQMKVAMNFNKISPPDINKNFVEYMQAIEEECINPSYMNYSIIHNVVEICLFTISKLNEINETKAFACKAFTLALLSQLLQKLSKQVESIGLKNPAYKYNSKLMSKSSIEQTQITAKPENYNTEQSNVVNGKNNHHESSDKENISDKENTADYNGDIKIIKKNQSKRRRRRRVASSGSSDISDADTESRDFKSESCSDEYLSDTTSKSEDDSKSDDSFSDEFENDNDIDVTINGNLEEETNKDIIDVNNKIDVNTTQNNLDEANKNENKLNIKALEHFLLGDNILQSIKLLQDWALSEKDLILSCGESGETLFQCVVDLLNTFIYYFNPPKLNSEEKIIEYARHIAKRLNFEYKSIPLAEDINLRGTNICKFDKDAAEWHTITKSNLLVMEENIIRILHFIDFGFSISKIIPRIRYNKFMKIYYFKKILPPKVNTKLNHKRSREWYNSKKQKDNVDGGLLRRLGRLWLTSQVRELEQTEQVDIPTLLAVDTTTLHEHLRRIKQLLRSRNFIFLIPSVVLQELDELKRERSTARDAIRWLEVQLKSGSRFLKTQKPNQSKPLSFMKYPKKAPQNVLNFVQILEFCNHFIADEKNMHGGNGDADNSLQNKTPFLILLVGNDLSKSDEQFKEFSVTGVAQAAGISVQYVGDFHSKWRQTIVKSGKKR